MPIFLQSGVSPLLLLFFPLFFSIPGVSVLDAFLRHRRRRDCLLQEPTKQLPTTV